MSVIEQLRAAKLTLTAAETELRRLQAIADADEARTVAKRIFLGLRAEDYPVNNGFGGMREIDIGNDAFRPLSGATQASAEMVATHLNDTFDRIAYALENPDTAVSFTDDGTPRLIADDDSGIDHEALFKIGRAAR